MRKVILFVAALMLIFGGGFASSAQASNPYPKNWTYMGSCYARGGLQADFYQKRGESPGWHLIEVQSYTAGHYDPHLYWYDKSSWKWLAPPNYHVFHFRNSNPNGHWVHALWIKDDASADTRRCSEAVP